MSKFYQEYEDEFCFGPAVGRVTLRIIGGICMGLGVIQVNLFLICVHHSLQLVVADWADVVCIHLQRQHHIHWDK